MNALTCENCNYRGPMKLTVLIHSDYVTCPGCGVSYIMVDYPT